MIQNSLTAPEIVKQPPSLTPSDEDEDGEEEGQVTPLPGSTAELDMTWPMNDDSQHQVHMTVIPAVKVSLIQEDFEQYDFVIPEKS